MLVNKIVLSMALMRMLSGSIEIGVALFMLRYNDIERALVMNSSLALVGPIILMATTTVGLVGVSEQLSPSRFLWIAAGVTCLLIGILKK